MNLISEDYLMHHGVKGMKWGVRHDRDKIAKKERKIEKKAERMMKSGTLEYRARRVEFDKKKKLYDKYGVNKDFEKQHTTTFSYKHGKEVYKQNAVVYKNCIVKDKGGIFYDTETKRNIRTDDGELAALLVYERYGKDEINQFYKKGGV